MKRKSLVKIIFILVTILVLGVVGYFTFLSRSTTTVQEPTFSSPSTSSPSKPTPTTSSVPKDSATLNWKTYQNQKYGLEFKYPSNLGDPIVQSSTYAYYITFTNRRELNLAVDNPPYYSFGTERAEAIVSSISKNVVSNALQDMYPYYSKVLRVDGQYIFSGGQVLCGGEGGCNFYLTYHLLLKRSQESYSILSYSSPNLFKKYKDIIGGDEVVLDLLRKSNEDNIVRSKAQTIIDYIVLHNEVEKIYEPLLSTFRFLD